MKKIITALLLSASLFSSSALLADMVNINKATAAAIQHNLKGIGEKKAEAIVAYRKEHGEFKTLEEIKEVKGIGDGIFKKILADISLTEGVTELTGAAGAKGKPDDAVKTEKAKPSADDKVKKKELKKEDQSAGKS
ncbi:MAG: helix-hairpin-helix domain-containing protein [Thiolinea sp.]